MKKAQWQTTALAVAATVALGFAASDAKALALGRVTVQSALGEPLRADIDIPEINADEAASLRAVVASPEAFRAAGLEYSPALANVQITLQRRADGRYFLRLSSERAVNDPFIDLILETNWAAGRVVRDYTMLIDPPSSRQSAPPITAQMGPNPGSSPAPSSPPARRATSPGAAAVIAPGSRAGSTVSRAPAVPAPATRIPSGGAEGQRVTVQSGDTATRIAAARKPAQISLDQMLVAMLRSNPDAFVNGNINRLKTGAVLEVPTAEQAAATGSGQASQMVVAQSRDFNDFRRRLAEGLPPAQLSPADRQASGRVQAQVEDKKPAAAIPDKLTLSKGAVQGKAGEEKIARDRAAQDAAIRVAELNKNISELNRLTSASPAAATSAPRTGLPAAGPAANANPARPLASGPTAPAIVAAAAPAKPAVAVAPAAPPAVPAAPPVAAVAPPTIAASAPAAAPASVPAQLAVPASAATPASGAASAVAAATPAAAPASSAASAAVATTAALAASSAASSPASAPAATASPAPQPAVSASAARKPAEEPGLIGELMDNPIVPAAAGGLLALLLGFGFYRARQRKKSTQVDSSFLESRLQPDSFFGASGGQRIDTAEGGATGSSMVYSPSQLDAAGDVDPVAEADVYLAYGRDLQAEEILKEALRINSNRVAIHAKLLEIYAKRRDVKGFEQVAAEAYSLTRGEGHEWEHICAMGHELDAANPLYRAGGQPSSAAPLSPVAYAVGSTTVPEGLTPAVRVIAEEPPANAVDLDLDLDFSLDDDAAPSSAMATQPIAARPASEPTIAMHAQTMSDVPLNMDFGTSTVAIAAQPEPQAPNRSGAPQTVRLDTPDLILSENSLNFSTEHFDLSPSLPPAPVAPPAPATADTGMIEFDLGSLSLDLDKPPAESGDTHTDDAPLSTAGFEDSGNDPLATKLALAEEFNAIGDPDGARSLAEEVVAEATGELRSRAQRLLAEIG